MPFVRYVLARWRIADREEACRIYFADALMAIAKNTGATVGGGCTMKDRLMDLIHPELMPEPDERTQEEIVASIWAKIGS